MGVASNGDSNTTLLILIVTSACLAAVSMANQALFRGRTLYTGQTLNYGQYRLIMQRDCNLVLYDGSSAIWASGTYNRGQSCRAAMQTDGNFVVYDGSGRPLWASNTNLGDGNYVLVLQDDRNLVIYSNPTWATGTNRVGTEPVVIRNSTASAYITRAVEEAGGKKIAMVTGH